MFNSTYGAGYRAGIASPRLQRPGGTRGILTIVTPSCPLSGAISTFLWNKGYDDGELYRLSGFKSKPKLISKIDWVMITLICSLVVLIKVL